MTISHTTDHLEVAQDWIAEYLRSATNFQALLEIFMSQIQDLEDASWEILRSRLLVWKDGAEAGGDTVADATDAQLDMIGELVGEAREGREDEAYADAIRFRVRVNSSSGTPEDLLYVLSSYYDLGLGVFEYSEQAATVTIQNTLQSTEADADKIMHNLNLARAAAIKVYYAWFEDADDVFTLAETIGETSDTQGLGDEADSSGVGGRMGFLRSVS